MSVSATAMQLADFQGQVGKMLIASKRQYDRGVNRDLSQQQRQDIFIRNITAVLQQTYQEGLVLLQQVEFDRDAMGSEGKGEINARVFKPFQSLIDELIQYALQKHRSSCALSNFPEEHNPSPAYIAQVLEEVERGWSDFVSQAAAVLQR